LKTVATGAAVLTGIKYDCPAEAESVSVESVVVGFVVVAL
jgi:hypothetical protein